jgi:predicted RNase H-like nuclease (RuvC/YqgF family)
MLREESQQRDAEVKEVKNAASLPEKTIESNKPTLTPEITASEPISPADRSKETKKEPEKTIEPVNDRQNRELQNRVIDLESKLQQKDRLVVDLKAELEKSQELEKQLETQQRLIRELQDKLERERKAKEELEKRAVKAEKREIDPKEVLKLVEKPKYAYIMPNRPMTRLLDNPSAAKNLSNEEIGWFD